MAIAAPAIVSFLNIVVLPSRRLVCRMRIIVPATTTDSHIGGELPLNAAVIRRSSG
jgi:hypothetical protein